MAEVNNLRSLLRSICENTEGDTVTVRSLLNAVGRRSYGPIFLLLGFVAVSPLTIVPGANWLIALVVLVFCDPTSVRAEIPLGSKTRARLQLSARAHGRRCEDC